MHPRHDDVAPVAIGIGERQAVATATGDGPHFGERHDAFHEALTVDAQWFVGCAHLVIL